MDSTVLQNTIIKKREMTSSHLVHVLFCTFAVNCDSTTNKHLHRQKRYDCLKQQQKESGKKHRNNNIEKQTKHEFTRKTGNFLEGECNNSTFI